MLQPDFREELRVRIFVDPSEQAWQAVQEVVKAQSGACQSVLEKIDIQEVLGNLVGRGFNVKIPQKVIKPVRLPAGIRQSLEMQGIRVALQVKATGMKVSGDRIWYGANVALELQKRRRPDAREPGVERARPIRRPTRSAAPPLGRAGRRASRDSCRRQRHRRQRERSGDGAAQRPLAGFARYAFDAASSLSGVTLSGSMRTIR